MRDGPCRINFIPLNRRAHQAKPSQQSTGAHVRSFFKPIDPPQDALRLARVGPQNEKNCGFGVVPEVQHAGLPRARIAVSSLARFRPKSKKYARPLKSSARGAARVAVALRIDQDFHRAAVTGT